MKTMDIEKAAINFTLQKTIENEATQGDFPWDIDESNGYEKSQD